MRVPANGAWKGGSCPCGRQARSCNKPASVRTNIASKQTSKQASKRMYIYVRAYARTYIHTYIRTYVRTHILLTYVHTNVHTHTCIHACVRAYINTYVRTYVRTYIRVRAPTTRLPSPLFAFSLNACKGAPTTADRPGARNGRARSLQRRRLQRQASVRGLSSMYTPAKADACAGAILRCGDCKERRLQRRVSLAPA